MGMAQLFAPIALSLAPQPVCESAPADPQLTPMEEMQEASPAPSQKGWIAFEAWQRTPIQNQVRIEQRVIVRISPRRVSRRSLSAPAPPQAAPVQLRERAIGNCVPLRGIAGVQTTRDNRLLFYMNDRRVVRADLERSCRATDFYQGFYVESSADGQLCIDRDALQSRTGANCEVSRLRQLVAVSD